MEQRSISTNFSLDEVIDSFTYLKESDNGLKYVDMNLIKCLQLLRDLAGHSVGVNRWWKVAMDWLAKGKTIDWVIDFVENSKMPDESGLRCSRSRTGGPGSQHRLQADGKFHAVDPKGDEWELFDIIRRNAKRFYHLGLRRLEDPRITDGWLHMDTGSANHKAGFIRVVDLDSHEFDIDVETGDIVNINPKTSRPWPAGFKLKLSA